MTKYQSVKITFDLDDEYQLKLYEYLKDRTNGSSYIRTLLHQDMANSGQVKQQSVTLNTEPLSNEVVKEQSITNSEQSGTVVKSNMQSASVKQTTHHDIKLMINNQQVGFIEEDINIDDLI